VAEAADIETFAQSGSGVRDLRDMTLVELEQVVSCAGEASYRARQVMRWLWMHDARSADVMLDVPLRLRQYLKQHFSIGCLTVACVARAADGTRKLLLRLDDGAEIESVIIPTTDDRTTLCISSQAGCAMGCQFCATARMGLHRNLAASEILGQILAAKPELTGAPSRDCRPERSARSGARYLSDLREAIRSSRTSVWRTMSLWAWGSRWRTMCGFLVP
jgi:23S rRNA (adenine2503-C2)-methyltransferase